MDSWIEQSWQLSQQVTYISSPLFLTSHFFYLLYCITLYSFSCFSVTPLYSHSYHLPITPSQVPSPSQFLYLLYCISLHSLSCFAITQRGVLNPIIYHYSITLTDEVRQYSVIAGVIIFVTKHYSALLGPINRSLRYYGVMAPDSSQYYRYHILR